MINQTQTNPLLVRQHPCMKGSAGIFPEYGQVFTELPNGQVQNMYQATIINKSNHPYKNLEIKLIDPKTGKLTVSGADKNLNLDKEEVKQVIIFVKLPKDKFHGKHKIKVGIYDDQGKLIDSYKTVFIGPVR
jgi:hypothetical protein